MPPVEKAAILHVPAGNGQPDHIDVQSPARTEAEQMSVNLRRAYGGKVSLLESVRVLLRKLD
jgi:hypothetical protein